MTRARVIAEDLRDLADYGGPFDQATRDMLREAADICDEHADHLDPDGAET